MWVSPTGTGACVLLALLGEEDMHTFAKPTNKQKLKGLGITLPYTEYCILIKSEVFFIYNRPEKPNMKHVQSRTQGSGHIHHDVLMLSTHCVPRPLDTG